MSYRDKHNEPPNKSKDFHVLFAGGSSMDFMEAEQNILARFQTQGLSEFLLGTQTPTYQEEEPKFRYYITIPFDRAITVINQSNIPINDGKTPLTINQRAIINIERRQEEIDAARAANRSPVAPGEFELTPEADRYPQATLSVQTTSVEEYYNHLDKFKAARQAWQKEEERHHKRYSQATILFESCLSEIIYRSNRDLIFSQGLNPAWEAIKKKYSPGTKQEGMHILGQKWLDLKKGHKETMISFVDRIELLAQKFEGFNTPKTEDEMTQALTHGLQDDEDWIYYSIISDANAKLSPDYFRYSQEIQQKYAQLRSQHASKTSVTKQDSSYGRSQGPKGQIHATEATDNKSSNPTVPIVAQRPRNATSASGHCYVCFGPHLKNACDLNKELQARRNYYWSTTGKHLSTEVQQVKPIPKEANISKVEPIAQLANRFNSLKDSDSDREINMVISADSEPSNKETNSIIGDSGSTHHIKNGTSKEMENYLPSEGSMTVGNRAQVHIQGIGKWGVLNDVQHVPNLSHSMISIPTLDIEGKYAIFGGGKCFIVDEPPTIHGSPLMTGDLTSKRLYEFKSTNNNNTEMLPTTSTQQSNTKETSITTREQINDPSKPAKTKDTAWTQGSFGYTRTGGTVGYNLLQIAHIRSNHSSKKTILKMLLNNSVKGMNITYEQAKNMEIGICEACQIGNMKADPIPLSKTAEHHKKAPLQRISTDPVPMGHKSLNGNIIMIVIIDYATNLIWTYYAKNRKDYAIYLEQFKFDIIDRYKHHCEVLETDCDKSFTSEDFQIRCQVLGIHLEMSTPYLHRPNLSENAVNQVVSKIRIVLAQAKLPKSFWELAADYVVYHLNRTIKSNQTKTPWELVTGQIPDASMWRAFGSQCLFHRSKDETVISGGKLSERAAKAIIVGYDPIVTNAYRIYIGNMVLQRRFVLALESKTDSIITPFEQIRDTKYTLNENEEIITPVPVHKVTTRAEAFRLRGEAAAIAEKPRRSSRVSKHITNLALQMEYNENKVDEKSITPLTVIEALTGPDKLLWKPSIEAEVKVYTNLDCLKPIESLPIGRKAMKLKVVFKIKVDQNNKIKYKTRIALKGYSQQPGIDYDLTYAPTLSNNSFFMIIEYAVINDWETDAYDISYAYPQAEPDRQLFVEVSDELIQLGLSTSRYNELMTNMYGTKQGGRNYSLFSNKIMLDYGLTRSENDVCVYYIHDKEKTLIVMVFVDDIITTGNNQEQSKKFGDYLLTAFKDIKHFGSLQRYLGINHIRNRDNHTITCSQAEYAKQIVEKFLPNDTKVAYTAMSPIPDIRLVPNGDQPPIWDIVGAVRYLADNTRPDLLVAAGILGSFQRNPSLEHLKAARHLLRYVNYTKEYYLTLGGFTFDPRIEVDASFRPQGDSLSTYGYASYYGQYGAANSRSKKISRVVHNPAEAETFGITETVKEAMWIAAFCEELGFIKTKKPIKIFTDSSAAIDTTADYGNYSNSKYYNKDNNFIRQKIQDGTVELVKIPRVKNTADLLTNTRDREVTEKFSFQLLGKSTC